MNFQASKTHGRLRIRSTVARVALAVALMLSANGAMAATSQVHKTIKPAHAVHTRQVATAKHRQFTQRQVDLPAFVAAMFGVFAAPHATHGSRATSKYARPEPSDDDSPAIFESSPVVDVDNSQSQAAIDASDQAIQQMDQDLFQMDETVDQ